MSDSLHVVCVRVCVCVFAGYLIFSGSKFLHISFANLQMSETIQLLKSIGTIVSKHSLENTGHDKWHPPPRPPWGSNEKHKHNKWKRHMLLLSFMIWHLHISKQMSLIEELALCTAFQPKQIHSAIMKILLKPAHFSSSQSLSITGYWNTYCLPHIYLKILIIHFSVAINTKGLNEA